MKIFEIRRVLPAFICLPYKLSVKRMESQVFESASHCHAERHSYVNLQFKREKLGVAMVSGPADPVFGRLPLVA